MAPDLLARGTTVLHDVVAPADVVVSPAGVFVVLMKEDGSRADLRAHVRTARSVLDGAGLPALPVEGIHCVPFSGVPVRLSGDALVGDLEGIRGLLGSDVRFGPATRRRAVAALARGRTDAAPSWVAGIAEPAPAPATPAVPTRDGAAPVL